VSSKLTARDDKHIFRLALKGIIPEEILSRPKQGFIPPLGVWLRGALRPLVEDTMLAGDSFVSRYFNGQEVRRLVGDHFNGSRDHSRQVYGLLQLELWERLFIRQQSL
jgi:asparagine synthase (glutamine-hydrolysing)